MLRWIGALWAARAMKRDPWLREMTFHVQALLSDPKASGNNPWLQSLHDCDEKTRTTVAEQLCEPILAISSSADRVIACRKWIVDMSFEWGTLHSLFSEAGDPGLHPCQLGLLEHVNVAIANPQILQGSLYDLYRKLGTVEAAREALRVLSCRKSAEMNIANFGRVLLDDFHEDREDWFKPYLASVSAFAENGMRTELELSNLTDELRILGEYVTIEANLLRGYKYPLEGVKRATPPT